MSVWWRAFSRAERQPRLALERVCNLPADPWLTNGVEADPEEARREVETAWQMAKQKGWRDPSGRLIE